MRNIKAPKPKAIIFDLRGTAVKTSFIEKVVIPYIKTNVKSYVEQKWTEKELKKDVEHLRAQSHLDESAPRILGTDFRSGRTTTVICRLFALLFGQQVAPFRCLSLTSGSTAWTIITFRLRSIQTLPFRQRNGSAISTSSCMSWAMDGSTRSKSLCQTQIRPQSSD